MTPPSTTALLLALLISLPSAFSLDPPASLTIGGLFPMQGGWSGGVQVKPASELALSIINADSSLLPSTTLSLVSADTQCSADLGLQGAIEVLNNEATPSVILGAGCSGVCEIVTRYASTIAKFEELASAEGIEIGYHGVLTATDDPQNVVDSLAAIKNEVNVVFFHGYEPMGRKLFYRMHEAGLYGADRLVLTPGWWKEAWFDEDNNATFTFGKEAEIKEAADGALGLSTNVQLNLEKYTGWKEAFLAHQPETEGDPIYHIYLAHDAVYSIAKILEALRAVSFSDGVSGPIEFDGNNRVGAFKVLRFSAAANASSEVGGWAPGGGLEVLESYSVPPQIVPPPPLCTTTDVVLTIEDCDSAGKRAVAYAFNTTDEGNSVCEGGEELPEPTEVDCEYTPASSTTGMLATLLGAAGAAVCICWSLYMLKNKKHKAIVHAQLGFCLIFSSSAGLMSLSQMLFVGPNTDVSCTLRPFLFNILFDVMFGSLIIKTYRVWKLLSNKSLRRVKVTFSDTAAKLAAVVAIDIVLLIIWKVTDGMQVETVVNDDLMPYGTYTTEECNKADVFEFATGFFKVLLVGVGALASWYTRQFPADLSEAFWIAASIYQVLVFGLVGLLWKGINPGSVLLVQGVLVPIAAVSTTSMIFAPKVQMINNPDLMKDMDRMTATAGGQSLDAEHAMELQTLVDKLQTEIEGLKKSGAKGGGGGGEGGGGAPLPGEVRGAEDV
ncbi:hypothetical protein TeGR_g8528 [Tetraparma gracilis]|uniref:G-protein coupled receptors family 3 profile domain-containing protein n=1 Tax=Tetraparma gracilis TaxID=2962635 RepID=A0ABQ6MJQ4_9STRA|nr:hypothetical protein TeGR_g8528 [Tetraparma gracilis]